MNKINFNFYKKQVSRNISIFLKDKLGVLFSLFAPLILFVLFVTFLGKIQVNGIVKNMPKGFKVDVNLIKAFIDNYMIAAVVGLSIISVSLSASFTKLHDNTKGALNDFYTSPIKKSKFQYAYIMSNFITTVILSSIILFIGLIFLAVKKELNLSFVNFVKIVLVLLISSMSATLLTSLLTNYIKSQNAIGGIMATTHALIGFICGAYMPLKMLPKVVQGISLGFPPTYSISLFRNYFLDGTIKSMKKVMPNNLVDSIVDQYAINPVIGDTKFSNLAVFIILIISIFVFALLFLMLTMLVKHLKLKKAHKKIATS